MIPFVGGVRAAFGRAIVRAIQRKKIAAIEEAGADEETLDIVYLKKTTGEMVERTIRPYEMKPHRHTGALVLYATDTLHGAGNIHSFLVNNIRKTDLEESRPFRPKWPVLFEKA